MVSKSEVRRINIQQGKLMEEGLEIQEPPKIKESEIENEIFDFLERIGAFPLKFENQGTFDSRTGMRRKVVGGKKRLGVSDLFFSVGGRLHVCEVKTPEKYGYIFRNWNAIRAHVPKPVPRRTPGGPKPKKKDDPKKRYQEQIEFIEKMKSLGHGGFFADSVQRVCLELLKEPHLLSSLQTQECSRLAALLE
jgi:hypothetical protein